MEFKTLNNLAAISIIKGHWKPMFKFRFNDTYFDINKREQYEKDLRIRLFQNNIHNIVITPNEYPFNFGDGIIQLVIWIRKTDPGIKTITDIIEKLYPDMDYNIIINKIQARSIKSILHYHAVLKIHDMPFCLKKLIIFHMNSDELSGRTLTRLSPMGHKHATKFGSDLRRVYQLDDLFLQNIYCLSAYSLQCRETMEDILDGLSAKKSHAHIMSTDILNFKIDPIIYQSVAHLPIYKSKLSEYMPLLTQLNELTKIDHQNQLISLYLYRSVIKSDKEVELATTNSYNLICQHYQDLISDYLEYLISFIINLSSNMVLCSTYDHMVFMVAKYFASKNGIENDLELPGLLSNVRIEQWSDGITRIFYNNCCLGEKLS